MESSKPEFKEEVARRMKRDEELFQACKTEIGEDLAIFLSEFSIIMTLGWMYPELQIHFTRLLVIQAELTKGNLSLMSKWVKEFMENRTMPLDGSSKDLSSIES